MNIFWFIFLFVGFTSSVMLSHDCPYGEEYKSCMFYTEYTCWYTEKRLARKRTPAKRLDHCWGGCVCRHDMVRAYPNGSCVQAFTCRDQHNMAIMERLPQDFVYF